MRERLRQGTQVRVDDKNLAPEDDSLRNHDDVVATVDDEQMTWGEVKGVLMQPNY
jgi:hypothetical protein